MTYLWLVRCAVSWFMLNEFVCFVCLNENNAESDEHLQVQQALAESGVLDRAVALRRLLRGARPIFLDEEVSTRFVLPTRARVF
jgi:hypothetical protein